MKCYEMAWSRLREALVEELAQGQERAEELDVQMREACEKLSLYKATLEAKKSPMSESLQASSYYVLYCKI